MFLNGILIFFIFFLLLKHVIYFYQILKRLSIKVLKSKPINLKEKYGSWAVVTGSTDGIGKEYAKELVKRNINVVLISRTLEKLKMVKTELESLNSSVEVKIIQADFSKGRDVYKGIEMELKDINIGILVNNVGFLTEYPKYFEEISEDELWNLINTNIGAVTILTRMLIKPMLQQGKGAIVNVSSGTNIMPIPLMSVYAATKSYVRYLTDAIRYEHSKSGLTIQCLSPFFIRTNMIPYEIYFQNQFSFPDAKTYAKNAIETLGKLDSTAGYWMHDIQEMIISILPKCLTTLSLFQMNVEARHKKMNPKS